MADFYDDEENVIECHQVDFEPDLNQQDTLIEKTLELNNIEEVLTDEQGVSQQLAVDLQNIATGMHTLSRHIRSYTVQPSPTNYKITFEDIQSIHRGIRIGILAVMLGILAKIAHFIYKAWKSNGDAKNTSSKLGDVGGKLEVARAKLSQTHIDKIHHMFAVHMPLIAFVNDKLGDKLPKPLTSSNVKEVFTEKYKGFYSQHLGKKMTSFSKGIMEKNNTYEKLIKLLEDETKNHIQVIERAFETVKAFDKQEQEFKATDLGFKFDRVTSILSELKVAHNDTNNLPEFALQQHVTSICKVNPDLTVPDYAHFTQLDSKKIGDELSAFKYDEFLAANESFTKKVSDYKTEVAGKDNNNKEVNTAFTMINRQTVGMAQLAQALHQLDACFRSFMLEKNKAAKQCIEFDISVLKIIGKANDIITPAEIKLVKEMINSSEKTLEECQ